jgi:hypothetical protein
LWCGTLPKAKSKGGKPHGRRWVPKADIQDLKQAANIDKKQALTKALVDAARSVGMTREAEAYTGVRVTAFRGRRPGEPSRRKQPVIEGAERIIIAEWVHEALGKPQFYEKLKRSALKVAVADVAADLQNLGVRKKTVDACYREFRDRLQTEEAFVDWPRWIVGFQTYVAAKRWRTISRDDYDALLNLWRGQLLRQINKLANR